MHKVPNRQVKCNKHIVFGLITHTIKSETLTSLDFTDCLWKGNLMFMWPFGSKSRKREGPQGYSHNIGRSARGTIHLRRWQIFTIFDPYPPTIGIPAKYLWRGFLFLMYCDLLTIGPRGHPSPIRHADVLNGWSLILVTWSKNQFRIMNLEFHEF